MGAAAPNPSAPYAYGSATRLQSKEKLLFEDVTYLWNAYWTYWTTYNKSFAWYKTALTYNSTGTSDDMQG